MSSSAFNGKEVQSVSQLRNLVARTIVGKDAQIKILRDGKEQTICSQSSRTAIG